jgi:hypothetical protein
MGSILSKTSQQMLIKSNSATIAQNRPVPPMRPGVIADARAAFERLVKRSIEAAREQRPAPSLFAPETPHRSQPQSDTDRICAEREKLGILLEQRGCTYIGYVGKGHYRCSE